MSDLAGRVVVVSPHLDDAALSLGGTISHASRSGASIDVLTVFGGDPGSRRPAGGWDRRCGFRTEGEAARARREEDRQAWELLGARPVWLSFADEQYAQDRDRAVVVDSVRQEVGDADAVLLPGFPLTHADHDWLAKVLVGAFRTARLGLYLEQPYANRRGGASRPGLPQWLEGRSRCGPWLRTTVIRRDRAAKFQAVSLYSSQLPALGLAGTKMFELRRQLWSERLAGGERLAWLSAGSG